MATLECANSGALEKILCSFPKELSEYILSHVSIADLHRLRLAGLGSTYPQANALLKGIQKARILSLQRLMDADDVLDIEAALVASQRLTPRERATYPRPSPSTIADFGRNGEKLVVNNLTEDIARIIAQELPNLHDLTIDLRRERADAVTISPNLALCQQLSVLRLYNAPPSLTEIPPPILRLRQLEVLDLDNLPGLTSLPHNIGKQLPRLRFIDVERTSLDKVPESLLVTLEDNCDDGELSRSPAHNGVRAGGNRFPPHYWIRLFENANLPKLGRLAHEYGAYLSFFNQWRSGLMNEHKWEKIA